MGPTMTFFVRKIGTKEYLRDAMFVRFTDSAEDALQFPCPVIAKARALKIYKNAPHLMLEVVATQTSEK